MSEERARSGEVCGVDGDVVLELERRRARRPRRVWRAIQGAEARIWCRMWDVYWTKAKTRSWPPAEDMIL
jgi:hypothetical protein